jgi:Arc/MetJ-type ribon-helix-helix transcriptional regulator
MATLTLSLSPEQEAFLAGLVGEGGAASLEEAIRHLIEDAMFARQMEGEDLSWMKPYVDEADEQIKRGKHMTLDEYRRRMDAHMKRLPART